MPIDFSQFVCDMKGEPFEDSIEMSANGGVKTLLTLRAAVCHSLNTRYTDEQSLKRAESYERGKLAYEIFQLRESKSFKAEDVKLMKDCVAKLYPPSIVFPACNMLDPAEQAPPALNQI